MGVGVCMDGGGLGSGSMPAQRHPGSPFRPHEHETIRKVARSLAGVCALFTHLPTHLVQPRPLLEDVGLVVQHVEEAVEVRDLHA